MYNDKVVNCHLFLVDNMLIAYKIQTDLGLRRHYVFIMPFFLLISVERVDNTGCILFFEAYLLCYKKDVTSSLTHEVTFN